MRKWFYVTVINPGPIIMVRYPCTAKPGQRRYGEVTLPRPALTRLMHTHGLRGKDISYLNVESYPAEWDPADHSDPRRSEEQRESAFVFARKMEDVYAGIRSFAPAVWLYDWNGSDFVLVREGTS